MFHGRRQGRVEQPRSVLKDVHISRRKLCLRRENLVSRGCKCEISNDIANLLPPKLTVSE